MRGGKTLMGTVLIDHILCMYTQKNPLNDDSRSVFNNHY